MRRLVLLALLGLGCATAGEIGGVLRPADVTAGPIVRDEITREILPPHGLKAESALLRSIPLEWDPVIAGDVAGYVIERGLREGGDFQRVGLREDRFATAFVDRGSDLAPKATPGGVGRDLGDGATYFYRLRSFDSKGRVSRFPSEIVTARTAPLPARPEGLRTYSHQPRLIALSWRPVPDETVAGYVIYRSPSRRGEYLPIQSLEGRHHTTFVDEKLGDLRVFYYRVAAVNAAGGEGLATTARRGVTKPEPLPPLGLRVVDRGIGWIRLGWEPNVEPDIQGYRLLRVREGEKPETVAVAGPGITEAVDESVGAGEERRYQLLAFDTDGLTSVASDPIEATGIDYGLTLRFENGGVHLDWDSAVQASLASTRVLRDGFFGAQEVGSVSAAGFIDEDIVGGRLYRYRLVGLYPDGREAPPSALSEIQLPRSLRGL